MKQLILSIAILVFVFQTNTSAQWGPVIIAGSGTDYNVSVESKNNGTCDGVIIVWRSFNAKTNRLMAQKIDPMGNILWTQGGIIVDANTGIVQDYNYYPQPVSDNAGGCVIVYGRNSGTAGSDYIYGCRINSSGTALWGPINLYTGPSGMRSPRVSSIIDPGPYPTHQNLIYVVSQWENQLIVLQMLDITGTIYGSGVLLWEHEGIHCLSPQIVADGSSETYGVIVTWLADGNNQNQWDILAQRVTHNLDTLWPKTNVIFTSSAPSDLIGNGNPPAYTSYANNMVATNNGAICAAFQGNFPSNSHLQNVFAAYVDLNGNAPWGLNGINISNYGQAKFSDQTQIVSDGSDGACIFWQRNNPNQTSDIFGKRISASDPLHPVWGDVNGIIISEGLSNAYTHNLTFAPVTNGINTFYDEILIPWFNAGTNSLYFQPRNVVSGGIFPTFFPSPVLVSTGISNLKFSVSPVVDLSYTSGVVIYNTSNSLLATAYSISDPHNPSNKQQLSENKGLQISAYPNPFNPVTNIEYYMPYNGLLTIEVFDVLGQKMKTLVDNQYMAHGNHTIMSNGEKFSSGIYFLRIETENQVKLNKIMLIK